MQRQDVSESRPRYPGCQTNPQQKGSSLNLKYNTPTSKLNYCRILGTLSGVLILLGSAMKLRRMDSLRNSNNSSCSSQQVDPQQQIVKTFKQIDSMTVNIDQKLSNMLRLHETEFVAGYRQHLTHIKDELAKLNEQIQAQSDIIKQYESDSTTGKLMRKIKFLEDQQMQLLGAITKKSNQIKDLKLEISIKESENRRLEEKVKQLIRTKLKSSTISSPGKDSHPDPNLHKVFSTELTPDRQTKSNPKVSQASPKQQFSRRKSFRSEATISPSLTMEQVAKMRSELSTLRKHNRELIAISNRELLARQEAEDIFVGVVAEMKKSICSRKKITECSLEDFRKEDKLELFIKLLSNEQIIASLYSLVFKNKQPNLGMDPISNLRKQSAEKAKAFSKAQFPVIGHQKLLD